MVKENLVGDIKQELMYRGVPKQEFSWELVAEIAADAALGAIARECEKLSDGTTPAHLAFGAVAEELRTMLSGKGG
jgi:hypothetical protein